MESPKANLLVVDDEQALCEALSTYLELEGYSVTTAASSEEALTLDLAGFDLILLDIMMGEMSGTELAAHIKKNPETTNTPVIFLTAKDSLDDMVDGLRLGADDYISKPYAMRNVMARIESVLRRTRAGKSKNTGGVICDRAMLECVVDGKSIRLPRKEFEILALFLENRGRIFTRDEIMNRIWPEDVIVTDRTVDVHVTRLRNKISPYGRNIISRSGYGYGWKD